ncbi:unnamed protein product [Nyctereutes procyonoides]|uniref:(raccoon dog) hypothetical protein n=1 Tax=Nyctereutes procyonoides TaxID=34880 RepID=A0A811YK83_NYCPR|nr:unnamed protein product [Nyctereutes procyonoides]
MPSKDKKKKKKKTNAVNSAKKDKDSVNTSGDRPKRNSPKPGPLQEFLSKGLLELFSKHSIQVTYTRNTNGGDAPAASKDA